MKRLVRFELKKVFLRWPMLIILVVFSLADLYKINNLYQTGAVVAESDTMKSAYLELYEEYKGEITTEKAQDIVAMYREVEDLLSDHTLNPYTEDSITGNLYNDKRLLESCFYEPMEYLYTYKNMATKIVQSASDNQELYTEVGNEYESKKNSFIAELYSGRSIDEFYTVTGYQFYFYYDFSALLAILTILYGLSQVFSRDKECSMDMLLLTNQNGGTKTMVAKVMASSIFLSVITVWFALVDYIGFSLTFGMGKAGSLPVYAVANFAAASVSITLNQYLVVSTLCKLLGFWTSGMLFLVIAQIGRNALIPFVCDAVLFTGMVAAGMRWSSSSNATAKVWNPYSLLTNRILFGETEFVNLFGTPVLSWMVAIMVAFSIGLIAVLMLLVSCDKNKFRKGAWYEIVSI